MVYPEPRAKFVANFEPSRMFRVPRSMFPLAVRPKYVNAAEAEFMRPSDWVIGVRIGGHARCYPAWMLDNYHVVNDIVEDTPIAVMHCEICCSNAVYRSIVNGSGVTFGTAGLYGGTLAVYDMQTGSHWSHGMGAAFEGPLVGATLQRIESFQASWQEWMEFFPETTVMVWDSPECHPDARHGHGSRDTFARAGMYPEAVSTMDTGNDERLRENEMVLTIDLTCGHAALPLREIARGGGLFQMDIGGTKLVAISAGPASSFVGVFERRVAGNTSSVLEFERQDENVKDIQTGSIWRADGSSIAGPLCGLRLEPVPTMLNKWHSLACFLRGIPLLEHRGPAVPLATDAESATVLSAFMRCGFAARVDYEMYLLEIPNGATHGLHLTIDDDPFELVFFEDELAAEDDVLGRRHSLQSGRLVLSSAPERQFKDSLNVQRLLDSEIKWSTLVGQARLCEALRQASTEVKQTSGSVRPSIADVCRELKDSDYRLIIDSTSPRDTLPVAAVTGLQVSINDDSFLLYRFFDPASASRYSHERGHSIAFGSFTLCSDPSDLYAVPAPISTQRKPDRSVGWSKLLHDSHLSELLNQACKQGLRATAISP